MKLYLAGPMSGLPDDNIPAFHEGAARFRALGYEIVSPAETDGEPQAGRTWAEWMRRDIALLLACDGVVCLPGWENSRGATLETDIARALGMPILCGMTLREFPPTRRGRGFGPSLDDIVRDANAWQREAFPFGTAASAARHLLKEAHELFENPTDPEEMADALLLVAAVADRAGVDLKEAAAAKLAKNKARVWGEPDEHGVVEHVREEARHA